MHKSAKFDFQTNPLAINMRVRVRTEFWQNAHVRAMCMQPKIECANVRACEAKNRRNSQFDFCPKDRSLGKRYFVRFLVQMRTSRFAFKIY